VKLFCSVTLKLLTTCSIMCPNTLHAVFTTEHSVCMGGHYISTSALWDTCYGIYPSFVTRMSLTGNGCIREAFMLLARVLAFYSTYMMSYEADGLHQHETGKFLSNARDGLQNSSHSWVWTKMTPCTTYLTLLVLMAFLTSVRSSAF
jgi:hypothetical protein